MGSTLDRLSLMPVHSVIHTFTMVRVLPSIDKYVVSRFGPMHSLFLGVSRLLKTCLIHMLSDEEKMTNSMRTSNRDPSRFNQIKNRSFRAIQIYQTRRETFSSGSSSGGFFKTGQHEEFISSLWSTTPDKYAWGI